MSKLQPDDLKDVTDFLAATLPFSFLTAGEQFELAKKLTIQYLPSHITRPVEINNCLYIVRTGAFEIHNENNDLVDRLGEGECFGVSTILYDNPEHLSVLPIEDSLVFRLIKEDFLTLLNLHPQLAPFFEKLVSYRKVRMVQSGAQLQEVNTQLVADLIHKTLISAERSVSIQQAAILMRKNHVSCLPIVSNGELHGIVTDRDFRNRFVAAGLNGNASIASIMTERPVTVSPKTSALNAQVLMSERGIHHLPVVDANKIVGMLTTTDIVRSQSISLVHFVDRIHREQDEQALAAMQQQVPKLMDNWIQADVSAHELGEFFSVIGDAFVRKAIALTEAELGKPSLEFAWLCFGSQARKEQSFSSDQDNGLILKSEPTAKQNEELQTFTTAVCQRLDQFGYDHCPGNIMASNPAWRKTIAQWQSCFVNWVETPEPEALLNASIFFDLRVIAGPADWLEPIVATLNARLANAELFFMHLAANALRAKPPIGFFRDFIVDSSGEHQDGLDIKHKGIALINDIARIHALANQNFLPNTLERLSGAKGSFIQLPLLEGLQEAWLLLNELKLEHQAMQIRQRKPADNFIDPEQLSPLKKSHLKSAFKHIARVQKALALHYRL